MHILGLERRALRIQELISPVDNDGNPVGALLIKLQDPDNEAYISLVKTYGSTSSTASRKSLLSDAVKHLTTRVANCNIPSPKDRLRELCNYVQDHVKLLPIEVPNEGESYLVFDTTNTRGLRLSPSEALKARLATVARQDHELSEELMRRWKLVATAFESARLPVHSMDDYLHAILCWREGYTTKRTLDRIASRLTRADDLRAFVQEFVESLDFYCNSYLAVVAPDGKSSLTEDLRDLRALNVQSQSFLTMVHKHSHNKFEKAVGLVLSLQIRNITMGPHQANKYEKDWPKWAALARQGKPDQAFDEIRGHMIQTMTFSSSSRKNPLYLPRSFATFFAGLTQSVVPAPAFSQWRWTSSTSCRNQWCANLLQGSPLQPMFASGSSI